MIQPFHTSKSAWRQISTRGFGQPHVEKGRGGVFWRGGYQISIDIIASTGLRSYPYVDKHMTTRSAEEPRVLVIHMTWKYLMSIRGVKGYRFFKQYSRRSRARTAAGAPCALRRGGTADRLQCTNWFHRALAVSWTARTA